MLFTMTETHIGRVKWFNNSRGFGFITGKVGESEEQDIFAHHSAIVTKSSQFKYLVPGEYVEYTLNKDDSDKISATNITGVNSGLLLCETRREIRDKYAETRSARAPASESTATSSDGEWQKPKKRTGGSGRGRGRSMRGRGRGRDGKPLPRAEKSDKSDS